VPVYARLVGYHDRIGDREGARRWAGALARAGEPEMGAYASVCDDLDAGNHSPTTRPAPLIEALRAGLAADPVVAKAWLVECKAALVAAEEGILDLDEPAGPPGATVRHLLAHASGLPFEGEQPIARPGERRIYSNTGFERLAAHVETAAEMPFADYLRTRLFEPLGMKDTAFSVPKEKLPRLALVHHEDGKGGLVVDENRPNPTVVPLGPSGGGGLFSTAMDYARFCEMLLGGGQLNGVRVLAPRTVEMMRTNHVNPEPLKTMAAGTGWGMDFQVVMDAAAAGEPYSNGSYNWYGIAGTWFWIDPVEDFAFIGMLQHQNLGSARQVHGLSRNLVYQAIVD